MSTVHCGICGRPAQVVFSGFPGYQEPHSFDIARCQGCRTSFALGNDANLEAIYEAIYRQAARVPGYQRYVAYANEISEKSDPLRHLAEQEAPYWGVREFLLASGLAPSAGVLEVGSGLGYMTYALAKAGFRVTGIDISAAAVESARRRFGDLFRAADLFEFSTEHAGEYDVLILTEVVEHLRDPYPFLRACLDLLKPGGSVVISTPNRDSFAPDVVWDTEAPPVHLWWFTRQSFEVIGGHLGCEVAFVDLSAFPQAAAWREQRLPVGWIRTRSACLDASGELLRRTPPRRSLLRRVLSRVARIANSPWNVPHKASAPRPRGAEETNRVSPNLVTVLTKRPARTW